jgi:hypothetical protein
LYGVRELAPVVSQSAYHFLAHELIDSISDYKRKETAFAVSDFLGVSNLEMIKYCDRFSPCGIYVASKKAR